MEHLNRLASKFNKEEFNELHEEITFSEYLDKVYANPNLVRTAYQRLYDMIMAEGSQEFYRYKNKLIHYSFFDDLEIPIFGLEETLDELVKFFKGAAGGYGTEKRVLLLHGPVGSSKSTILRRIKKGLETYSHKPEGAWYSFKWINLPTGQEGIYTCTEDECPMHEEPLKLIPLNIRKKVIEELNEILKDKCPEENRNSLYSLTCHGELDPRCRKFMSELMRINQGDWKRVVENHIRIVRKVYSEADRCGIATFQPKDEKNQDATELTGDINFRNIGHFGTDSDPRAFNFDGEFCIGNRGLVEFIEMLKLAQEFLYDLLGASQERQIKPKKFPQIAIDEAIIGHSVHGDTPIPHEYDGVLDVLTISELSKLDVTKLRVFSVNIETHEVELSEVRSVFSHEFKGEWVENHQNGDILTTTPNHSVYNKNYETFYPGEDTTSEILTIEIPDYLIYNIPKTKQWTEFFTKVENNVVEHH